MEGKRDEGIMEGGIEEIRFNSYCRFFLVE